MTSLLPRARVASLTFCFFVSALALNFMFTIAAGAVCPENMTAYWKLDESGTGSYADVCGSLTGSCRTGGCPTPEVYAKIGGAQTFNRATDTGISLAGDAFNWLGDSFSIEFWIFKSATVGRRQLRTTKSLLAAKQKKPETICTGG